MDLSSTSSLSPLAQTEIPVSRNVPVRHVKAFLKACSDRPRNTCSPQAGLQSLSWKPQLGVPHPLLLKSSMRGWTSMPRELFSDTSRLTVLTSQSHTGFPTEVGRILFFSTLGHIFLSHKVPLLEPRVRSISQEVSLVWASPSFTLMLKPDGEQTLLQQLHASHCPCL